MNSTTAYHHGHLRVSLLEEAARVLEADGAAALSLRGLARTLGVSHSAPGHHFANRHELLAELAADGFAELADAMEAAMAASTRHRWQAEIGRPYIRFALDNPGRYRLMFASQLSAVESPERLAFESSRAYLALLQAVRQEVPRGDPATYRIAAPELGAWSVVHGAAMLWLDGQLSDTLSEAGFLELIGSILDSEMPDGVVERPLSG